MSQFPPLGSFTPTQHDGQCFYNKRQVKWGRAMSSIGETALIFVLIPGGITDDTYKSFQCLEREQPDARNIQVTIY